MTKFQAFNDIRLDLSEFEDAASLSKREERRIFKQFKHKIWPKVGANKWLKVGVATLTVSVLSLSLVLNKGTIANIPLVGGIIESYIHSTEQLDYTPYKTAIGETAENAYGKLTLNEVMIDDQQILLSATFEPAEHVAFNYRTQITPTVSINGSDEIMFVGSQSIELNHTAFAIYNEITLPHNMPHNMMTENVQLTISYDKFKNNSIEQPWAFDIEVSQAQLLAEREVFELNEMIVLGNGDVVIIEKVVSTPISTTVYYDLSQSTSEDIAIHIKSEDGSIENFSSFSFKNNDPGEVSFKRYSGYEMTDTPHFLEVYDADAQLSESLILIK